MGSKKGTLSQYTVGNTGSTNYKLEVAGSAWWCLLAQLQGWPILKIGAAQAYCHFLPFATNLIIRDWYLPGALISILSYSYLGAAGEIRRRGLSFMQKAWETHGTCWKEVDVIKSHKNNYFTWKVEVISKRVEEIHQHNRIMCYCDVKGCHTPPPDWNTKKYQGKHWVALGGTRGPWVKWSNPKISRWARDSGPKNLNDHPSPTQT